MIGHIQIIEARVNGYQPKSVWVHLLDHEPTEFDIRDAEDALQNGFGAQILIAPSEKVKTLKLMAVRGLNVHIIGGDDERVIQMNNQLLNFQPASVNMIVANEYVQELAA